MRRSVRRDVRRASGRIVERQHLGLREHIRRPETEGVARISFDLDRASVD